MTDPFPASQLAYAASTIECGYPVVIKKTGKCEDCNKLPCLVQARMKCYAYKCKSPYVVTGGMAYFIPKTVII